MAQYLDPSFGVADARRERLRKRVLLSVLTAAVLGAAGYFLFRDWSQEQVVKQFLSLLGAKNYQAAYKLWGCSPETPCRDYPPEKFTDDWGPTGLYSNAASLHVDDVDHCGDGVVFNIAYPKEQNFGLWVARDTNVLSFAPWN